MPGEVFASAAAIDLRAAAALGRGGGGPPGRRGPRPELAVGGAETRWEAAPVRGPQRGRRLPPRLVCGLLAGRGLGCPCRYLLPC